MRTLLICAALAAMGLPANAGGFNDFWQSSEARRFYGEPKRTGRLPVVDPKLQPKSGYINGTPAPHPPRSTR